MAHCPNCISYNVECTVDQSEWDRDCPYYKPRTQECSVCHHDYDIEAGCVHCENVAMWATEEH